MEKTKKTKFLSALLAVLMLFMSIPARFAFAADDTKTTRTVYLHAQGENPAETTDSSIVYMGDTADIYMAVDNPNKGEYIGGNHTEPQFDMNGYSVRIFFDPTYFAYAGENRIDYTIPDTNIGESGAGAGGSDASAQVGYFPFAQGSEVVTIGGKEYQSTYLTVFFSGSYLPQKAENQLWYNLCKLPLRPLRTGATEVFIDLSGKDDYSLELFAKNVSDDPKDQKFTFETIAGGHHDIVIKDKNKPDAPEASIGTGRYTGSQSVSLSVSEDGCGIYYSVDGGISYMEYDGTPIAIEKTTKLMCYAVRTSDDKQSNTVTYTYNIVPNPPYLFGDDKTELIPTVCNRDEAFSVYAAESEIFAPIADESEIYYTFSEAVSEDDIEAAGENPETGWVKVEKQTQLIEMDQKRTVRLVTVKMDEVSEAACYLFGIKPSAVTADPQGGSFEEEIDVTLDCASDGAKIYYTIDGSDPKTSGMEYKDVIAVTKSMKIRAVAVLDGIYGDESAFDYTVVTNPNGVSVSHPSGIYEGGISVAVTANDPAKDVEYSVDDGKTWIPFAGMIAVDRTSTVIVRTAGEDKTYSYSYTIKPFKPVFAPAGAQYNNPDKAVIYCAESTADNMEEFELLYTTDGSDPRTSGTAVLANGDCAQVDISEYTSIAAVIRRNGEFSDVVSNAFEVVRKKPTKPIATRASGCYNQTREGLSTGFIHIPEGMDIYYTAGTRDEYVADPIAGGDLTRKYEGEAIPIDDKTVIKAVCVNPFGVRSDTAIFDYTVTGGAVEPAVTEVLESPYASAASGKYEELDTDGSGCFLSVALACPTAGAAILYREGKTGEDGNLVWGEWTEYGGEIPLSGDTVLQSRSEKNGECSAATVYAYTFVPPAPDMTLASGRYVKDPPSETAIVRKEDTAGNGDGCDIFYRTAEENLYVRYTNEREIDRTTAFKAYVTKDGRTSASTICYYILEAETAATGSVYVSSPYDVQRISAELLNQGAYADGIHLLSQNRDADIYYMYSYTKRDGTTAETNTFLYDDAAPILVNSSMESITITAWLEDRYGKIENSQMMHKIDFVHLKTPVTSLGGEQIVFPRGTVYTIINDYPADGNIIIYYTTDGSNPADPANAKRIEYNGSELKLNGETTLKTVYFSACGKCAQCVSGNGKACRSGAYGKVGEYKYTIKSKTSSGGGGGGGGTTILDPDVPTGELPNVEHKAYIKGYPDGTVKPNGYITREEMAAIIYRVKSGDDADKFVTTGEVFPDVALDRWSVREIEYMADKKVIQGYPNGTFEPEENLTRGELSALISRLGSFGETDKANPFPDLDASHWAYNSIMSLYGAGIVDGYEDGTFKADDKITRAEVMTVMNRYLGRKPLDSYVRTLKCNPYSDLDPEQWFYTIVLEATIGHDFAVDENGFEFKWRNY